MTPLTEIEKFFKEYDFKDKEIQLKVGEKIINPELFVKTHIRILNHNKGNKRFLPYYLRLEKLYKILKLEL